MLQRGKFDPQQPPSAEEMARLGLSAEDLTFLISPSNSFSPTKKKHRGTGEDGFGDLPIVETIDSYDHLDKSSGDEPANRNAFKEEELKPRITPSARADLRPISSSDSMDLPFESLEEEDFSKCGNIKQRAPRKDLVPTASNTSPTAGGEDDGGEGGVMRLNTEMEDFLKEEMRDGMLSMDILGASTDRTMPGMSSGGGSGGATVADQSSQAPVNPAPPVSAACGMPPPGPLPSIGAISATAETDQRGMYLPTGAVPNMDLLRFQQQGQGQSSFMPDCSAIFPSYSSSSSAPPSVYSGGQQQLQSNRFSPSDSYYLHQHLPPRPQVSSEFYQGSAGGSSSTGEGLSPYYSRSHGNSITEIDDGGVDSCISTPRVDPTGYYSSDAGNGIGHQSDSGRSTASGAEAGAERRADQNSKDGTDGKDSRAAKSLTTISRRFVEVFGNATTLDYIAGKREPLDFTEAPQSTNRVDAAAQELGVHVRRIYELIKILEILSLVTFAEDKRGRFTWKGTANFLNTLGKLQDDGIRKYPELAASHGLVSGYEVSETPPVGTPETMSPAITPRDHNLATAAAAATDLGPYSPQNSPRKERERSGEAFQSQHSSQLLQRSLQKAAVASAQAGELPLVEFSLGSSPAPSPARGSAAKGHRRAHSGGGIAAVVRAGSFAPTAASYTSASSASAAALGLNLDLSGITGGRDGGRDGFGVGGLSGLASGSLSMNNTPRGGGIAIGFSPRDGVSPSAPTPTFACASASATPRSRKRAAARRSGASATAAVSRRLKDPEEQQYMVEGICKSFLQLFLLGLDHLPMSYVIQCLIPMNDNQPLSEYNKLNATKIRRVYDVANVLCSLNLINKTTGQRTPKGSTAPSLKDVQFNGELSTKVSAAAATASGGAGRASDSKLLEWNSFSPTVIRECYLNCRLPV